MIVTAKLLAEVLVSILASDDELPVPLKALVAAAVVSSRGGAPTKLGMATTGGYSYGSSATHYPELLNALIARIPREVSSMVDGEPDPVLVTRLRGELQQRDTTIAELRGELANVRGRNAELRKYALALHHRVDTYQQQEAAEVGASVRPLHAVDEYD